MILSELSERLLREHAQRTGQLFYGIDILGSMFRDADVARLDEAYEELAASGLMAPSGVIVSYFGAAKNLHRVTQVGMEHARRQPAA